MVPFRFVTAVVATGARTTVRRVRRGPSHPSWSLGTELVAEVARMAAERTASLSPQQARQLMEARGVPTRRLRGVTVTKAVVGGVPGEWVEPTAGEPRGVVLYLHGGGYALGSPRSHRHFVAALARAGGIRCFVADYRLAPEHPYPAALEDAVAAYRGLLDAGVPPSQICVAGDSAGGGLTLCTMVHLRDAGVALPAGAALLSPWVDLACSGASIETNARFDYLSREAIAMYAGHYVGELDVSDPRVSPLGADLCGLPPLLVSVGDAEALRDEGLDLVSRARAAGVDVTLEVGEGMVHVYPLLAPLLPVARPAVPRIAEFLAGRVAPRPRRPGRAAAGDVMPAPSPG